MCSQQDSTSIDFMLRLLHIFYSTKLLRPVLTTNALPCVLRPRQSVKHYHCLFCETHPVRSMCCAVAHYSGQQSSDEGSIHNLPSLLAHAASLVEATARVHWVVANNASFGLIAIGGGEAGEDIEARAQLLDPHWHTRSRSR